jgi:hypothetical protein
VLQEEAPALIGGAPSKIGIERSTARVSVSLSSYGLSTRFRSAWLRHGASPPVGAHYIAVVPRGWQWRCVGRVHQRPPHGQPNVDYGDDATGEDDGRL